MTRRHPTAQGFTLVETMVAGSLFVSVSLMVIVWLMGVSNLWYTATTQSFARANALQAMTRMTAELHSATRTNAPASPAESITTTTVPPNSTITFFLPTDTDGNGLIIDVNGNTEWDVANPVQYVFDSASQQLRRLQGGQTVILANNVTNVRFDDSTTDATLSSNQVKINLTLQMTTPDGRVLAGTSTEIVKLRN